MDVPDANVVVDGLSVAEADVAAAVVVAVVASSRCLGVVAVVVAPGDVMMLDADESCCHSSHKLPDASKNS